MKFITKLDKWKSVEAEVEGGSLTLIIGYDGDPIGEGREIVHLSKQDCSLLATKLFEFLNQK